jgi:hypothetical protein
MARRRQKREPVTLDQEGQTLSGLGQDTSTQGIGASIWDFLHPSQVQAEYAAVGKDVPTTGEVLGTAFDTAIQKSAEDVATVEQAAQTAAEAIPGIVKWIAVAIVAYVLLQVIPKSRG